MIDIAAESERFDRHDISDIIFDHSGKKHSNELTKSMIPSQLRRYLSSYVCFEP